METEDCRVLDQNFLQVRVENLPSHGISMSRNLIDGSLNTSSSDVRERVETCLLEGSFTRENFPLLYDYLSGKTVKVKQNVFRMPALPEDLMESEEKLLSNGKNHFAICVSGIDYVKIQKKSFRLKEVGRAKNCVDFFFDMTVTLPKKITDEYNPVQYLKGVPLWLASHIPSVLWDLLNHGDELAFRRSSLGIIVYKLIDNWDDCLSMVMDGQERYCRGLVRSFQYLSEFLMDWKYREELNLLESLRRTPYLMADNVGNLLAEDLGKINLDMVQQQIRRTEIMLNGLKSVETIMQSFIDRIKKRNPNGIDLRVSLGNWRPVLALLTVVKVAQDAVSYVDDPREHIAIVARLVINGDLSPADLPAI